MSAVYPMLMQAVPMLTQVSPHRPIRTIPSTLTETEGEETEGPHTHPQGKEGVASPTQGSTSIFTAALAPLTEAADKALRAAEAAGGVCVEGEEVRCPAPPVAVVSVVCELA